ncbi:MAG: hypothetical protein AAFQ82_01780 [Myxococcota bacterium]
MKSCKHCRGFVPTGSPACPNCGTSVSWRWRFADALAGSALGRRVATVVGPSAFSVVLMACYGAPPCDDLVDRDGDGFVVCDGLGFVDQAADCDDSNPDVPADNDGDGYFTCGAIPFDNFAGPTDCDDADPSVPVDADGDGVFVCGDNPANDCNDADNLVSFATDQDRDGFLGCGGSPDYPDCDDESAEINPSAEDLDEDGVDQNCDGRDGPT